tara:strand:- start:7128 stop:7310 length:183 start_codon:yes stop_codon:yes gene_type:complete
MEFEKEGTVTISREAYTEFLRASNWLLCLEEAGVDNWDGIPWAFEIQEEYAKQDLEDNPQ